jgi:two-component system sensor histidine kinase KdpD
MILHRGPVLMVAALSAVSWNFLFIPPLFTMHIAEVQDALMFVTYFVVAIAIGSLTSRLRAREQSEREREQRATALYQFAQKLAAAPSLEVALTVAADHITALLGLSANVVLDDKLSSQPGSAFPIKSLTSSFGVLQLEPARYASFTSSETQLLEAFADQLAIVIERERLKQLAAQAQLGVEAERLRKTLLDCVSHELKTPIAAIGAASQELARHPELSRQLAGEIQHGSRRLNRVVNNLLDMTRLESGVVQPKLEWCDVRELLRGAIEEEEEALRGREIRLVVWRKRTAGRPAW